MITLKDDQNESIEKVRDLIRQGCRAILLQGATGSGKSIMSSFMVSQANQKNKRSWFTVPRKDLITQMSDTFQDFTIPHSFIASGRNFNPNARNHIISTETLKGRLDDPKLVWPDIAIIDETHFGGAGLNAIITELKKEHTCPTTGRKYFTLIIGLSASPMKMNGQGLECWYDEMVCGPSVRWLIDNNRLSDYRAFSPNILDLSQIRTLAGEYNQKDLAEKMENDRVLIGNSVQHYKEHAEGKLGVTFGVSRKHSELLAEAYRAQGIPAIHVDGETPPDERRRIFIGYAKGELKQLCCAELLTFGFDIQAASGIKGVTVQSLTDCAPTKSLPKQLQKWGRALRYEGRPDAEPHTIFDHANNIGTERKPNHGLPCNEREWTLKSREKGSGSTGPKAVPVRLCPSCFLSHKPTPICPSCKYEYPPADRTIEEVDGKLIEIEIKNREKVVILEQKKKARMQVGMAKTLADLREIAKERKYSEGWVYTQARLKKITK